MKQSIFFFTSFFMPGICCYLQKAIPYKFQKTSVKNFSFREPTIVRSSFQSVRVSKKSFETVYSVWCETNKCGTQGRGWLILRSIYKNSGFFSICHLSLKNFLFFFFFKSFGECFHCDTW